MSEYAGRRVVVVGLGRTGEATAKFLLRRGAAVTVTDIQCEEKLRGRVEGLKSFAAAAQGQISFELGGHSRETLQGADLVVVSPGVPLSIDAIAQARGVRVISEIELAARHLRGRIVGITGSNGKTTTTTLVGEMLRSAGRKCFVAGNIGLPLIGLVDEGDEDTFYVTEISSFQLEAIESFRPHIAAILNITPDHLDRYPSFEAYAETKKLIFKNQTSSDYAVLNADDPLTSRFAEQLQSRVVFFSRKRELERGAFVSEDAIFFRNGSRRAVQVMPVAEVALKGAHNLENVCAAVAIAVACGASIESIRSAVRSFRGVEHRLEFVDEIDGIAFYNDSKATNVDAAIKAIEAFPGNITLILGGKDKGGDFARMRGCVSERVRQVVLMGEASRKIADALKDVVPLVWADSMAEAVRKAYEASRPGDVVLLAPACASFDMFENFEHRGRAFKEEVRRLKGPDVGAKNLGPGREA